MRRSDNDAPSTGGALTAEGRATLEALLEDLVSLKEEIDETLWEDEDDEE